MWLTIVKFDLPLTNIGLIIANYYFVLLTDSIMLRE